MKKLIMSILIVGNSLAAINITDIWRCRPSNPDSSCSKAKRQEAEAWFRNANVDNFKALAANLRTIGVEVTFSQLQKEQEFISDDVLPQQSEQFKEIQRKIEEMQRQRQRTTEQMVK